MLGTSTAGSDGVGVSFTDNWQQITFHKSTLAKWEVFNFEYAYVMNKATMEYTAIPALAAVKLLYPTDHISNTTSRFVV